MKKNDSEGKHMTNEAFESLIDEFQGAVRSAAMHGDKEAFVEGVESTKDALITAFKEMQSRQGASEPAAWLVDWPDPRNDAHNNGCIRNRDPQWAALAKAREQQGAKLTPLYTHPPSQPVELTDEQKKDVTECVSGIANLIAADRKLRGG